MNFTYEKKKFRPRVSKTNDKYQSLFIQFNHNLNPTMLIKNFQPFRAYNISKLYFCYYETVGALNIYSILYRHIM